jgi:Skp family chaperone for outer membrane proteins
VTISAAFLRLSAGVVFLAATAVQSAPPASAQSQPGIVLGVVDFDLVMNTSKAGKNVKSQFEQQRTAFEAEYEKQRKAFRDAEKKLADQRASLSDADFKKKVEDLDAQGDKIEKALAQRRRSLDTGLNKAVSQIRTSLIEIVTDIATKREMTLVLNKSDIILAADAYDFTEEAMKRLDAKLPSVKLQISN